MCPCPVLYFYWTAQFLKLTSFLVPITDSEDKNNLHICSARTVQTKWIAGDTCNTPKIRGHYFYTHYFAT